MADETEKTDAETTDTTAEEAPPSKAPKSSKAPPASRPLSKKIKKKKSAAEVQKELSEIGKSTDERPPVDMKKMYLRVAGVAVVVWIIAFILPPSLGPWPKVGAGLLTLLAAGVLIWLDRYVKKTQKLGAILKGADTEEGRKKAIAQLNADYKKGDTQATIAKAQLLMQEDPRAALATLEAVNLEKELAPIAGQVRAMRAMLHLTLGETAEARALADKLELGKQQEPKTRVLFATVAGEAWARSGQGRKAVDTLDLFNPDLPEHAEMKAQMWRSRAFAYAAVNDTKNMARAVKKLADINPHLLGMFLPPQKKVHPLLEREAKQLVQRLGIVQRKMVRQKM